MANIYWLFKFLETFSDFDITVNDQAYVGGTIKMLLADSGKTKGVGVNASSFWSREATDDPRLAHELQEATFYCSHRIAYDYITPNGVRLSDTYLIVC